MVVKDTPEVVIIFGGHSLGVILAELGVVSTVTVLSVSSPGEMEVKEMSGGLKRSFEAEMGLILTASEAVLGGGSVSGVPSTEIERRDIESSEERVFEETAWDP